MLINSKKKIGASTIQDVSSLQTGFYCEGPKLSLPQWSRANCGVNRKPNTQCTFISISLRLRSGMVSVQPQLSLELGWTLVLLFLTFHVWWGQKEGCSLGMQQKAENPNEGIHLICQHCLVSHL